MGEAHEDRQKGKHGERRGFASLTLATPIPVGNGYEFYGW